MDSEEKELLRQLVAKVNTLQSDLEKRDKEIKEIKVSQQRVATPQIIPEDKGVEFGPAPDSNDRLANIVVGLARDRKRYESIHGTHERKVKISAEELRKQYGFGELARFALKNNLLKTGKESTKVSGKGPLKVKLN